MENGIRWDWEQKRMVVGAFLLGSAWNESDQKGIGSREWIR